MQIMNYGNDYAIRDSLNKKEVENVKERKAPVAEEKQPEEQPTTKKAEVADTDEPKPEAEAKSVKTKKAKK